MKCWILQPNENWIVDEMAKQFKQDNAGICTENINEADVVWAQADWCFDRIPHKYLLLGKPIVTMLHHFVPEKFDRNAEATFRRKDQFTTAYTAPNFRTRDFVIDKKLTNKPVHVVPYWVHTESWKKTGEKSELRKKYGIPDEPFIEVIGSFQRDTEGHDLKSPKLEKGPDILSDFVIEKYEFWKTSDVRVAYYPLQPFVVLAGWRRQYIISRFEAAGIPYKYFELPDQVTLNELYQTLDLYPMSSRYEGGPQSLLESGIHKIPMVSRPAGMAESVLPASAINDNLFSAEPSVPNVEHLKTPFGYAKHIEILKSVIK